MRLTRPTSFQLLCIIVRIWAPFSQHNSLNTRLSTTFMTFFLFSLLFLTFLLNICSITLLLFELTFFFLVSLFQNSSKKAVIEQQSCKFNLFTKPFKLKICLRKKNAFLLCIFFYCCTNRREKK